MRSVMIVSPDPEAARMLALAFELEGWNTRTAASLETLRDTRGMLALLVDAVEGSQEFRKADVWKRLSRICSDDTAAIVILPRGVTEEQARKTIGAGPRLVLRPYELLHLVRFAAEIVPETAAAPRPKAAAKRTPARRTASRSSPARKRTTRK